MKNIDELKIEDFFDLNSIPKRDLYCAYYSYAPVDYTFPLSRAVEVGGASTKEIVITLTPHEFRPIREWFYDRGKKYIREVSYSFRTDYPKVYDKLYSELANLLGKDYQPMDAASPDCPWPQLYWPEQLLKEMQVEIPED